MVGLAVMVAGALFAVQRRWLEYRLLAGEGDRWPTTTLRSILQLVAPVLVGTALGVGIGAVVATWLGPATSLRLDVVDLLAVAVVAGIGLILAALATGFAAQRTLDTGTLGHQTNGAVVALAVILVAATAFLWYQAATVPAGDGDAVDLTVISLPLVALVTGIVLMVAALGVLVRLGRSSGGRLATPIFLAWRRITRNDAANALIIGSVGIGVGLVALSLMLVESLDRINDVKLATSVGAETAVELVTIPDAELPPESTIISFDPVRIEPGDRSGRVLAIDRSDYAAVVDWPDEFGMDVDDVVATLVEADVGDSVPVIVVADSGVAATGTFSARSIPYTVVGEVRSAPLAFPFGATMLVDAQRLNDFARARLADQLDEDLDADVVEARFLPPTNGYRHVLVSRSGEEDVTSWLVETAARSRSTVSRSTLAGTIDVRAPRIAFDYLRMLGLVAAVAAMAAVVLHLAAQRRRRAVAAAMTRRMGLSMRTASAATAVEVMAMTALAVVAGVAVAVAVANRLLARFDPAPELPPDPAITTTILDIAAWSILVVGCVTAVVWFVDWVAARRLRGGVHRAG